MSIIWWLLISWVGLSMMILPGAIILVRRSSEALDIPAQTGQESAEAEENKKELICGELT